MLKWLGNKLKARSGGGAQPPSLALFSEGEAYLSTFQPIAEELVRREIPFSYLTLDPSDPVMALCGERGQARCLGSGALGMARFSLSKAKVMIATTPNIGQKRFPLARPPEVGCLAHVFHSVCDISWYRKESLDRYDAVLMPGAFAERSIREVEAKRKLPAKECAALGLPYLDHLAGRAAPKKPFSGKPTLLLAPSWGAKSFLSLYGPDFILELSSRGFPIIFRPHPQSLKSEKALIEPILKKLWEGGTLVLDTSLDCGPSLGQADAVISDTSSIRWDFAFIHGRPAISLAVPEGCLAEYERADLSSRWEDDLEKAVGPVLPPGDRGDLAGRIAALLDAPGFFEARPGLSLRDAYVANFGASAKAIADWASLKLAG